MLRNAFFLNGGGKMEPIVVVVRRKISEWTGRKGTENIGAVAEMKM